MEAVTDLSEMTYPETAFYYMGLNSPFKRMMGVSAAVGAIFYLLKPKALFYTDGKPRGSTLLGEENGVLLPFWAIALGVGTLSALII